MDKCELFMLEALKEANTAFLKGEIPVGCVIVKDGKIIGRGHNTREIANDISGHAEINAIKDAESFLKTWKLDCCDLYVTLEPCMMCCGAIKDARIKQLFYGSKDIDNGGAFLIAQSVVIQGPILENECSEILKLYFKNKRNMK